MMQCVFAEQVRRGKNIYTRLEMHTMKGQHLVIENQVFVSTNDYSLGVPVSLESVDQWSKLSPGAVYELSLIHIWFLKLSEFTVIDCLHDGIGGYDI